MKKFPSLSENEVAVLFCEYSTGHVLDIKFKLKVSDDQKVYTVFSNLDSAILFSRKIVLNDPTIECVIYNNAGEYLKTINANSN